MWSFFGEYFWVSHDLLFEQDAVLFSGPMLDDFTCLENHLGFFSSTFSRCSAAFARWAPNSEATPGPESSAGAAHGTLCSLGVAEYRWATDGGEERPN